jgi:hypothetical protein
VNQNTWNIRTVKNKDGHPTTLYTYGLATCTALRFTMGSKKFLTHLSSETDIGPIVDDILDHARRVTYIKNIKISRGIGGNASNTIEVYHPSDMSFKKAMAILRELERTGKKLEKEPEIEHVCYAEVASV